LAEKKTPAQLRNEFLAVKQGVEQSDYDFARKVEELARACFGTQISEEFIQFQMFEVFVKGLRDTNAHTFLRYYPTKTLEAALQIVTSSTHSDIPTKKIRLAEPTSNDHTVSKDSFANVQLTFPQQSGGRQNSQPSTSTTFPDQAYPTSVFNSYRSRGRRGGRGNHRGRFNGRGGYQHRQNANHDEHNQGKAKRVCFGCKKPGHLSECYQYIAFQKQQAQLKQLRQHVHDQKQNIPYVPQNPGNSGN